MKLLGMAFALVSVAAQAAPLSSDAIGAALGAPVKVEGDTVRGSWAREDVKVTVNRLALPPAAGLTSWAAFVPAKQGAMVMSDTVLFQDEIDAAMDAALEHGLRITALHNHFSFDQPRALFMHLEGSGDPQELAAAVHAVWDAVRAVRGRRAVPAWGYGGPAPLEGNLDARRIGAVLGLPTTNADDVVKVEVGRSGKLDEVTLGQAMGLSTWAAFMGSNERAAVDGDFIMTGAEVQSVLRALRHAGIHVVALHNHMLDEEPHYYFLHFWGEGSAVDLARGVKAALDAQQRAACSQPGCGSQPAARSMARAAGTS